MEQEHDIMMRATEWHRDIPVFDFRPTSAQELEYSIFGETGGLSGPPRMTLNDLTMSSLDRFQASLTPGRCDWLR